MKSSTKWLLAAACGIAAVAVILLTSLAAPGASVVEPAVTAGDDNSEPIVVSHPASDPPSPSPTPPASPPSTTPAASSPSGSATTKPTKSSTKAKPVQRTQTPVYNDDDDDDDAGGDDDGDD